MVERDKTICNGNGYSKKNDQEPAIGLSEVFGNMYKGLSKWAGQKIKSLGEKFSFESDKKGENKDKKEELSDLVNKIRSVTHDENFRADLESAIDIVYQKKKKPELYSKEDVAVKNLSGLSLEYLKLDRSKDAFDRLVNEVIDPMCMREGPVKDNGFYPDGEPYAISAMRYGMGENGRGLDNLSVINFCCNENYQKEKGMHLNGILRYGMLSGALFTTAAIYGINHFNKFRDFYKYYINGQNVKDLHEGIAIVTSATIASGIISYLLARRIKNKHKKYDGRVPTLLLENFRKGLKNGK